MMKGFLFGLWYAIIGIARTIGYNLYHPFQCGFYYYLCHTIVLSLLFIVFFILFKHYKLRIRDNPVNIHMIAKTHITALIKTKIIILVINSMYYVATSNQYCI